jgi:hypothetical protein
MEEVLSDIIVYGGWLSGSFVRERLVREDMNIDIKDIDVLITFDKFKSLKRMLIDKHGATYTKLCYDKVDIIAHYNFYLYDKIIDVFSCDGYCYLSPPDVDVNTICWNGEEFITWFNFSEDCFSEDFYSESFDIDDMIERCKNKTAIAMTNEWIQDEDNSYMKKRLDKLRDKGWTIIFP